MAGGRQRGGVQSGPVQYRDDSEQSLKAGIGALAGLVFGLLARLALAVTMVGLVLWWLWVA